MASEPKAPNGKKRLSPKRDSLVRAPGSQSAGQQADGEIPALRQPLQKLFHPRQQTHAVALQPLFERRQIELLEARHALPDLRFLPSGSAEQIENDARIGPPMEVVGVAVAGRAVDLGQRVLEQTTDLRTATQ